MSTTEHPLNPREQKFADLYIAGIPAGRAYEQAGYKAKGGVADACASRLLRNAKVSAYIKAERERISEEGRIQKHEILDYLQEVIKTPVGDVDENSRLAQEVTHTFGDHPTVKIRMVGKMDAIDKICAMMGWNKPVEVKHSADDPLLAVLSRIRKRTQQA